jgi:hypothetical protein
MGKHGNKYQVNLHSQKNCKNLSQDLYAFSVNRSVHFTKHIIKIKEIEEIRQIILPDHPFTTFVRIGPLSLILFSCGPCLICSTYDTGFFFK